MFYHLFFWIEKRPGVQVPEEKRPQSGAYLSSNARTPHLSSGFVRRPARTIIQRR